MFVRISLTGHGNIIHIVITTGLWPMDFFPFGCEFRYKTMQGDENLQIGNLTSIGWFLLCKVSYHESSWSVDIGKTQTCRTRNQQIWGLSWAKFGLPLGDLTTRLRVKYILTSSDITDRHQWRLCLLRPSKQLENWVILPCNIPIIWNFYLYLWALGVSRIVQVESRESSEQISESESGAISLRDKTEWAQRFSLQTRSIAQGWWMFRFIKTHQLLLIEIEKITIFMYG